MDYFKLTRVQTIEELRKYAHPQHFHYLLSWSTRQLQVLVEYYAKEK